MKLKNKLCRGGLIFIIPTMIVLNVLLDIPKKIKTTVDDAFNKEITTRFKSWVLAIFVLVQLVVNYFILKDLGVL